MAKTHIVLVSAVNTSDYGEHVQLKPDYSHWAEGSKEFIKHEGVTYYRYTTYWEHSPYGWRAVS